MTTTEILTTMANMIVLTRNENDRKVLKEIISKNVEMFRPCFPRAIQKNNLAFVEYIIGLNIQELTNRNLCDHVRCLIETNKLDMLKLLLPLNKNYWNINLTYACACKNISVIKYFEMLGIYPSLSDLDFLKQSSEKDVIEYLESITPSKEQFTAAAKLGNIAFFKMHKNIVPSVEHANYAANNGYIELVKYFMELSPPVKPSQEIFDGLKNSQFLMHKKIYEYLKPFYSDDETEIKLFKGVFLRGPNLEFNKCLKQFVETYFRAYCMNHASETKNNELLKYVMSLSGEKILE